MSERIFGLVLAGGKSRRMGRDKALLGRGGRSQLAHAVDLLATVTERVFVSARADQADEPERARHAQIVDRYEGMGPVAGILSAMDEHPDVTWLVLACDLPNIDDMTLEFLVEQYSRVQPFTAFRSSHDGLPEPLCAIYRPGSDAIVRQFVEEGIVCPRKMLIRSDTCLLEQPNPAALENVNTPDDLEASILDVTS